MSDVKVSRPTISATIVSFELVKPEDPAETATEGQVDPIHITIDVRVDKNGKKDVDVRWQWQPLAPREPISAVPGFGNRR